MEEQIPLTVDDLDEEDHLSELSQSLEEKESDELDFEPKNCTLSSRLARYSASEHLSSIM